VSDGAPRGLVLTVLGRGYEPIVHVCDELRLRLDEILLAVEAELAIEAVKYGTDPFAEAVAALLQELHKTRAELERIGQV